VNHGKTVRSPQLLAGTRYAMKTWGKTPTYDEVLFVHFLRAGNQTFKQPNVQLKDMLPTDFYVFKLAEGKELRGKMKDLCLVRADTEARITFAELLQTSTALPAAKPAAEPVEQPVEQTVAAEEPAAEEPAESAVADVNEEMLLGEDEADGTVEAAADSESKQETYNEKRNRLRREQRAAARAAKDKLTALVTAPADGAQAAA
jgi:hypothetical protein